MAVEDEVKRLLAEGDVDGATSVALRAHGTEVLELLSAIHRDETAAGDTFALFAEGVWRGLPRFAWESSLRTWLYAVARRSSLRSMRDGRRRQAREAPLPEGSSAAVLVAQMRTHASMGLTEKRSRVAMLRDTLPVEDQTLLMLRVDRALAWDELARVMHEDDGPLDEAGVKREAARLRKRFQLVKERLHELARKEGLVT